MNKYVLSGAGLLVVIGVVISMNREGDQDYVVESELLSQSVDSSEVNQDQQIYVQIRGAVKSPGLYKMDSGSRVDDLIQQAGANDINYECVNLAQKLVDEQNLYVPEAGEKCASDSSISDTGIVNINQASALELQTISGIGEAKATAIVEYRDQNGTFETTDQLLNVEGISDSLLNSIADQISLS